MPFSPVSDTTYIGVTTFGIGGFALGSGGTMVILLKSILYSLVLSSAILGGVWVHENQNGAL